MSPGSERLGVRALAVLCAACYLLTSVTVYGQYLGSGYDLGIFDQAVRAYSHFHAPVTPLKAPDFNILGDHFHPILALIAPAYWIWDNPGVLLIAQDLLVAVSIPVVYRFARRRAGFWFSFVVAAAYGLSWPIQTLIDVQFHEVAAAVPLLALAIDALDRGEHRALLLWCAPLLLVREDMGILVALLGVLAYAKAPREAAATSWRERVIHRPPAAAVAMFVGGVAAYEVTTGLIIPALSPSHHFSYWQFDAIGHDLPDALGGLLTRPWHAAQVFVTPGVKVRTMLYLFAPLAFLPLCSPYVLIALPLLAERFFNSRPELWTAHFQYNALPWLVLVLASVDGAARVGLFRAGRAAMLARSVFVVILVGAEVWLTAVVGTQFRSLVPNVARLVEHRRESAALTAQRAGELVPDHVCVQATERVAPHLTRRDRVTLPDLPVAGSDFIVLDLSKPNVGLRASPAAVLAAARAGKYVTVHAEGSVLVLRAPDYTGPSDDCAPLGPGRRRN
ncbi:MAG: DUF2079 domain-containing protein [Actinomycetota bacterium]|nr:DUF2079 domain-containing protein [Actinomycetota bacterium]